MKKFSIWKYMKIEQLQLKEGRCSVLPTWPVSSPPAQ